MRFTPLFVFVLAVFLPAQSARSKDEASSELDTALDRMDRASANFRSLSADVRRVHHLAVINDDEIDSGTMLIKRSKPRDMRMLVDLTQPDRKTLSFQGRKVEIYYPKIQTVQEFDLGKNRELVDQFFLIGFGTSRKDLQASYNISALGTESIHGQTATRLELIPKSRDVAQHLKKFELWIGGGGYPVQQKFYLPSDETMLVTYSNVKINTNPPDSALKLQLPSNVKREYPQK